jgi:uncharacterized protein YkwD
VGLQNSIARQSCAAAAFVILAASFCPTTFRTAVAAQDSLSREQWSHFSGYGAANSPARPGQGLEALALDLINRDRGAQDSLQETKGLARPLQWDARLAAVARAHSEEMARNGYFSHESLDGKAPSQRLSIAGIRWRAMGENIAMVTDVVQAETSFMNEPKFVPNHRKNILNVDFTHVGIGIAKGPDGMIYVTQDFAQLP